MASMDDENDLIDFSNWEGWALSPYSMLPRMPAPTPAPSTLVKPSSDAAAEDSMELRSQDTMKEMVVSTPTWRRGEQKNENLMYPTPASRTLEKQTEMAITPGTSKSVKFQSVIPNTSMSVSNNSTPKTMPRKQEILLPNIPKLNPVDIAAAAAREFSRIHAPEWAKRELPPQEPLELQEALKEIKSKQNTSRREVSRPRSLEDDKTPNNLFVSGFTVGGRDRLERSLRHFFSRYGYIDEIQLGPENDGICPGYAFVRMRSAADATFAMDDMHGWKLKDLSSHISVKRVCDLQDLQLAIAESSGMKGPDTDQQTVKVEDHNTEDNDNPPKSQNPEKTVPKMVQHGFPDASTYRTDPRECTKVLVTNLKSTVTEGALSKLFEKYDPAIVHLPLDRKTHAPRGFAFVEMHTNKNASDAIKGLQDQIFMSNPLKVKYVSQTQATKHDHSDTIHPLSKHNHDEHTSSDGWIEDLSPSISSTSAGSKILPSNLTKELNTDMVTEGLEGGLYTNLLPIDVEAKLKQEIFAHAEHVRDQVLNTIEKNITQLRKDREHESQTLTEIRELLTRSINGASAEMVALKNLNPSAESEIKALRESKTLAKSKISALKDENSKVNSEIDSLRNSNVQAQSEILAARKLEIELKAQVEALQKQLLHTKSLLNMQGAQAVDRGHLINANTHLHAQNETLQVNIESLQNSFANEKKLHEIELGKYIAQRKKLDSKNEALTQQVERAIAEREDLKKRHGLQVENNKRILEKVREEEMMKDTMIEQLITQNMNFKAQLDNLGLSDTSISSREQTWNEERANLLTQIQSLLDERAKKELYD
ncbi:hypothetical protein BP6252_09486 [Coleophoma cylindrospora]|uniref:RRM domain-containing protein n=1 Tax=Coleophoma cylindrospora TaxID=1849047 RepID=A0A3D8R2B8_9HELO|nr:hypothetical protein BP6252_09486 [Coleophoma cylindrospora]